MCDLSKNRSGSVSLGGKLPIHSLYGSRAVTEIVNALPQLALSGAVALLRWSWTDHVMSLILLVCAQSSRHAILLPLHEKEEHLAYEATQAKPVFRELCW